jgi:mannose-1-phosphate guanylyltransferase
MSSGGNKWAIVLAAGEGSRLRSITTDALGRSIPKQYCSLRGERSLLGEAHARARRVVAERRIVTIVAAEHRALWEKEFSGSAPHNLIVQPRNRGTAPGLLVPLLSILERDPDARIVVLPSDHHVESESVLAAALRSALRSAESDPASVVLLGMTPDSADREYGWIVHEPGGARPARVTRFVEKPESALANELFQGGAVWNSFILAARGRALLDLFEQRLPNLVALLAAIGRVAPAAREALYARAYAELDTQDFSRDVLAGCERRLRVLATPPCGWTDLGTPERVAQCLARESILSPSESCGAPVVLERALALAGARTSGTSAP